MVSSSILNHASLETFIKNNFMPYNEALEEQRLHDSWSERDRRDRATDERRQARNNRNESRNDSRESPMGRQDDDDGGKLGFFY